MTDSAGGGRSARPTATPTAEALTEGPAPARRLGATTATLLVVASMIGTGVFTTTGFLVADIRSPSAVLLAWLVGGVVALCGALSYGELAAALPRNGGEYQLLSRIYHPLVGFVAGWISFVVGFSAPIAASALAFGHYLAALAPGVDPVVSAAVLAVALSTMHALHVTLGARVQNVLTLAKILLIGVFVVGGLAKVDLALPFAESESTFGEATLSPAFAVGLIFVSFAYAGWNGAVYVGGEVRRPGRNLPLALIAGTGLVVVLYCLLNLVFLSSAPAEQLAGVVEIGHVSAAALFGARTGSWLTAMIALALVSSVSAMIMAGPRVYESMGNDYPRIAALSRRSRLGGPVVALALQTAAVLLMITTSSFGTLLTYIGFTLAASSGLTVVGVMVLRHREPDLERPYRTLLYPATPLLFAALSLWMIVHALGQRPVAAVAGLATMISGILIFLLVRRS
jgi:APA family basic amino acid/polyamine antiporter